MNGSFYNSGAKPKNGAAAKKTLLTFAVLAVVVAVFIIILFAVFRDKEPYLYKTPKLTEAPVFFTDGESSISCLDAKNESVFLGIGELKDFVSSSDGKTVYALISGRTDKALLGESDFIVRIENSKTETVANYPLGTLSMVSAGNCEYLYYCVNSETDGEKIFLVRKGKEPELIIEAEAAVDSPSYAASPNGHYLICKITSDGETRTVRYSAKDGSCISLGIRNCEPVSIDNKGKYFSYLKKSNEDKYDFYMESTVEDRQKVELTEDIAGISVSADQHSFVIDHGAYVVFKRLGKDPVSVFTNGAEALGIESFENESLGYLSCGGERCDIVKYTYAKSFTPYFCYDGDTNEFICISGDGTKNTCLALSVEEYAVSDDLHIACVSGNSLYYGALSEKRSEIKTVVEAFGTNELFAISRDGKKIFFRDGDGNLFCVGGNGKDKSSVAVDVEAMASAENGNAILYIGDGILSYRNGNAANIDSDVEECVYTGTDLKDTVYLKIHDKTENDRTYDLYSGNTKKQKLICENAEKIVTYPGFYLTERPSPTEDAEKEENE